MPGYDVLDSLGRGGMGIVYLARQHGLNRLVALKMIRSGGHACADDLRRFYNEAQAVARLQHPNIVQIHEIGTHDGLPYFSQEFVEGGSLARQLADSPRQPRDAAGLVETLAHAVHFAHEHGIVHRDLKPANILMTVNGAPKIADFGLARQLDSDSGHTRTGQIVGTPSYMAPEQAMGSSTGIGPFTDVYALGAILYEMLTGRPPFKGPRVQDTLELVRSCDPVPPRHFQPSVPRDLETICLKCLRKEPSKRYVSAQALGEDLHRFLNGESIHARPVSVWERGWRWARRRPAIAALSAVIVVGVVIGFILINWQRREALNARDDARTASQLADQRADAEQVARRKAEAEHKDALAARDAEAAERVKAQKAQLAEAQQRKEAQANLYTTKIALARSLWAENNVARADELLDECQPELRGWEWRYLKRLCHSELLTLPGLARAIAFRPDGERIAVAVTLKEQREGKSTVRHEVRVCNARTGKKILSWAAQPNHLYYSPDGKQLIADVHTRLRFESGRVIYSSAVKVWDAETGKEKRSFDVSEGVSSLIIDQKGHEFIAAGHAGTVKAWSLATGELLRHSRIPGLQEGSIGRTQLALSPDGQRIAVATSTGLIKVWEIDTAKELASADMRRVGTIVIHRFCFSPDGQRLAMLDNSGFVKVYDVATLHQLLSLPSSGMFDAGLMFSPDGRYLASLGRQRELKLWDVRTGEAFRTFYVPASTEMIPNQCICFSPDGFLIAVGGSDAVRVWDVTTNQDHRSVTRNGGMVRALAISPDGRLLVSACDQALNEFGRFNIMVYDIRSGRSLVLFARHKSTPMSAAFHPDGSQVATGSHDGTVLVWEPKKTGSIIRELSGDIKGLTRVTYSPDGRWIAAAGEPRVQRDADSKAKGAVVLWNAISGVQTLVRTTKADVRELRFCTDGLLHAVIGDGDVLTWNPRDGEQHIQSHCPLERSSVVALSLDGRLLAAAAPRSGRGDGAVVPPTSIFVWDAVNGRQLHNLRARYSNALSLAFSPDASRLAYTGGDSDRSVRIWDLATGHETIALRGSRVGLGVLAFSKDGACITAGGFDPAVFIWNSAELTSSRRESLRSALAEAVVPRHFDEGQTAMDHGQAFAALFHLDRVVAAAPREVVAFTVRAGAHAQLGHWDAASQDYQRAIDLNAPIEDWYRGALVLLKQGDRAGYQRLCARLLKRFGETTNPQIRNTVVWTCVLGDASVTNPARLVELQKKSDNLLRRDYQLANTLGAALYRAGDIQGALKQLESAVVLNRRGGTPGDWLFQAMAHHRAGNPVKAKQLLDRSVLLIDRINSASSRTNLLAPTLRWEVRLELDLLRRETEALLNSTPK